VPSSPVPSSSSGLSSASSGGTLTLESLASVVDQIGCNMEAMQAQLAGLIQPPPPPQHPVPPPPPRLPSAAPSTQQAIFPDGMPQNSRTRVPLLLLQWSTSSSPIPSWALESAPAPIYTTATSITPSAAVSSTVHSASTSGALYGTSDGTLYYSGAPSSAVPASFGGGSYSGADDGAPAPGALNGAHAPRSFTSWSSQPSTAARIPSTGSTTASNFSAASALWLRIARGLRPLRCTDVVLCVGTG
jgi:hypothetical protein